MKKVKPPKTHTAIVKISTFTSGNLSRSELDCERTAQQNLTEYGELVRLHVQLRHYCEKNPGQLLWVQNYPEEPTGKLTVVKTDKNRRAINFQISQLTQYYTKTYNV
jgi:hypothetical protein